MTSDCERVKPSRIRPMANSREVRIVRSFNLLENNERIKNNSHNTLKDLFKKTKLGKHARLEKDDGIPGKRKKNTKSTVPVPSNPIKRNIFAVDTSIDSIAVGRNILENSTNPSDVTSRPEGLGCFESLQSGEDPILKDKEISLPNHSSNILSSLNLVNRNGLSISATQAKIAIKEFKYSNLYDGNGNLPLHKAVMTGKLVSVIRQCLVLLAGGLSLDLKNSNGQTALHLAVQYGERKITELLLKFEADPTVRDGKGNTALHLAIREEKCDDSLFDCFKLLMESNYVQKMINSINERGFSPLHLAAFQGASKETAHIVKVGAAINQKSADQSLNHHCGCYLTNACPDHRLLGGSTISAFHPLDGHVALLCILLQVH